MRYGVSDGTFEAKKNQPKLDIRTMPIMKKNRSLDFVPRLNVTYPREKKGFFLPFAIDVAAPFIAFRFDGDTGLNNCSCCRLSLSGREAADFLRNRADCKLRIFVKPLVT